MVVDGEVDEEDLTADTATEALDGAFDAEDFPTAAEMATLRAIVTPRIDTRVLHAFGSLVSPPAAPSRANFSHTGGIFSSRCGGCRRSGRFSPRCSCCGSGWQFTA